MMTFMTFSSLALLFMLSSQSQIFDWRMNIRTSHKGAAGQPLRKDTTHTKIRDTATGARERIGKKEPPRGTRNDKKDWRWNFVPQ
ncbi:hypothetical protein B0T13DRAFT_211036 [Neurospora crassa]|nr:hypothetical protein B0T13DRAFT_211036 [Neurospora crassa]